MVATTVSLSRLGELAHHFDSPARAHNGGYFELIKTYPEVASMVRHPKVVLAWRIDGRAVLDPRDTTTVEKLLNPGQWRGEDTWETRTSIVARTHEEPVITDDNLATEFWWHDVFPDPDYDDVWDEAEDSDASGEQGGPILILIQEGVEDCDS